MIMLSVSLYANYNILTQVEKYEETIEEYNTFIEKTEFKYNDLLNEMRMIDTRQMFEKDDDVGGVFQQLKKLIEDYKNFE